MTNALTKSVVGIGLFVALIAFAQEPARNIDPRRHPNLAEAQDLARRAYDRLATAQQANEFDMAGHAAKAKELLREASEEMKLAAMAANRR